jgi:hypothetical protein
MRPNWYGVWEFSIKGMTEKMSAYFADRVDDGI